MSKIRLYGATSGFVELQAPDVASDVTITLPNESGPFATEAYADAAGVAGSGLVAVKSAIFTGTQTASVTAGGNVAVTDLSITHEVADASNKLIISAFVGTSGNSRGFGNNGIAIDNGTGLIGVGASPSSRTAVTAGGYVSQSPGNYIVTMPSVTFVYTPGAGSKTYTVRVINVDVSTRTVYINREEDDSNSADNPRAASSLVIQEVRV